MELVWSSLVTFCIQDFHSSKYTSSKNTGNCFEEEEKYLQEGSQPSLFPPKITVPGFHVGGVGENDLFNQFIFCDLATFTLLQDFIA